MPSANTTIAPDLSIIVTAHAEGILLHRTLRSLLRSAELLSKHSITYEILIHVDNGTAETLDYIKANQSFLKSFQLFYNTFGDLGASRNFIITKAKADVIAVVDADDLFSQNWFSEAYTFLKKNKKTAILHTEWLINFGQQNLAWKKYNSKAKEEDALNMVWANRWDSAVIASKDVFQRFPYAANLDGFGSEDWHFGSETLAAGIPHLVVPKTIIFARRREVSEMSIQKTDFRTVHYTNLLDIDYFKNLTIPQHLQKAAHRPKKRDKARSYARAMAQAGYATLSKNSAIKKWLDTPRAYIKKRGDAGNEIDFPDWIIDEWRAMHVIDKQVFPDSSLLKTIPLYVSEMYELGIAYHNLLQYVSTRPDYIFIIPHLVAGGADLVVLNYVRALKELHPDWCILVISTDTTPSPWANRLPHDVDYMPWGEVCRDSGIWQDLHLQLFARLIVQLQCWRLHIIQSSLGFEFAQKYRSLLQGNGYTVYACAFCEDIDDEGRFIGHIHSGLPGAYPVLTRVFTDNAAVVNQLVHEYGYDPEKFIVHYQPAEITATTRPRQDSHKPLRILWASRISTQKRPDILRAIAQQLDPDLYRIDVYGSLHNNFSAEYFDNIHSLTYKGEFNGIESLPIHNYDVFLYTSANDGVPNILLGMAALGLPIIAPNSGGISEFIQDDVTGTLITPFDDVSAYIQAIEKTAMHYAHAVKLAQNAQELLARQHAKDTVQKQIRGLI